MITYASLARLRERAGIPAGDAEADARLLIALRHATAQIERFTARRFAPVVQTRHYEFQNTYTLRLDIDLLALLGLVNTDGQAFDPARVRLLPDGDGPYAALALPGDLTFTPAADPGDAILVTGIWGTHDRWSEAWRDSGDALAGAVDAVTAILAVADVTGPDAHGISPRFEPGQLIRIADEYLHITAVDAMAGTLTVLRGVRGTTAASHAAGATIDVYSPPEDVQALCLRWAAWLYAQVDAGIGGGADWLYPADLPDDLRRLAAPLRYLRVA
ncbi:MAG: hypothetical protein Kow0077_14590 [Anaerolineae bacterium]